MPEEPEEETTEEDEAGPEAAEDAETSLDEIIAKKADEPAPEEAEEDTVLETSRGDERVEPLAVKVVPQQPTEFVCKSCYLVKHRSQLADKRKMFCRDCVKKRN